MGTLLGPSVQNYFVYVLHFHLSGYSFIKVDGCHIIFVRVVPEVDSSYMVVCSPSDGDGVVWSRLQTLKVSPPGFSSSSSILPLALGRWSLSHGHCAMAT